MSNPQNHVFILMGCPAAVNPPWPAPSPEADAAMLDGDYLHPRANINKMAAGHALDDNDRAPWLAALNDAIFAMQRTNPVSLLVCSALKKLS